MHMLSHWDPFEEIARLQDQVTRFWSTGGEGSARRGVFAPPVDIYEDKDAFHLKVELPGMTSNDVHVSVENGVLTVRGERKLEKENERHGYHRIERSYGGFARSFTLPKTVDGEHLEAEMRDGILSLRLPKQAAPQPKRIPIREGAPRQVKPGSPS
jgi:HSP20 family protein